MTDKIITDVAIVTSEVPNRFVGTGPYFAYNMVAALLNAGLRVHVYVAVPGGFRASVDVTARERWITELRAKGAECSVAFLTEPEPFPRAIRPFVSQRIRHKILKMDYWRGRLRLIFRPHLEDLFNAFEIDGVDELRRSIESSKANLIVLWEDYGMQLAIAEKTKLPHMLILGDPPELSAFYRLLPSQAELGNLFTRKLWSDLLRAFHVRRVTTRALQRHPTIYNAVFRYAEMYKSRGLSHVRFIRNLAPDFGGADWQQSKNAKKPDYVLRLLHVGHLETTVNKAGIRFFANEVLPHLVKNLANRFEVHFIGRGNFPSDLEGALDHPEIVKRGYVEDLHSELMNADVFFVPTPIKLGGRVRIAYAWSAGVCVVAHTANCYGLIEMVDQHNALVGRTGEELADAIIRVYLEHDLRRRLIHEGRKTFELLYGNPRWQDEFVEMVKMTNVEAENRDLRHNGSPATVPGTRQN